MPPPTRGGATVVAGRSRESQEENEPPFIPPSQGERLKPLLEFGFGSALRTAWTEKLGCVGLFEDELSIDRTDLAEVINGVDDCAIIQAESQNLLTGRDAGFISQKGDKLGQFERRG